jgi:hypothetical protein
VVDWLRVGGFGCGDFNGEDGRELSRAENILRTFAETEKGKG